MNNLLWKAAIAAGLVLGGAAAAQSVQPDAAQPPANGQAADQHGMMNGQMMGSGQMMGRGQMMSDPEMRREMMAMMASCRHMMDEHRNMMGRHGERR